MLSLQQKKIDSNFIQIFNSKGSFNTLEVFKQCSALKACQKKRKLVHWVQFTRSFKLEIFRYKFNAPKNHDLFFASVDVLYHSKNICRLAFFLNFCRIKLGVRTLEINEYPAF